MQNHATNLVWEGIMALRFAGVGPNTGDDESPMVLVDDEARELVFQGLKPGEALRMAAIIRKALDDAERAGLL